MKINSITLHRIVSEKQQSEQFYKYCKTHARYHSIFTFLISLQMAFFCLSFSVKIS